MIDNDMTIFIIDDDPAIRDALTLMMEQAHFAVESYSDGRAFLDQYRSEMRGCMIVDLKMPDLNGIEFQEELNSRGIRMPIIFLTGHGNIPLSVKTVKAGASDFLTKPVSRETLITSIRVALQEYQNLQIRMKVNQHGRSLVSSLTAREQEVMHCVLAGHSNKKIAQQLGISHRTVEIHKARMMHKIGANNLLELVRIAQVAD